MDPHSAIVNAALYSGVYDDAALYRVAEEVVSKLQHVRNSADIRPLFEWLPVLLNDPRGNTDPGVLTFLHCLDGVTDEVMQQLPDLAAVGGQAVGATH